MRSTLLPLAALLATALFACDDGGGSPRQEVEGDGSIADGGGADAEASQPDAALPDAEPDAAVACTAAHRYDPLVDEQLGLFPDDVIAEDDPTSPTGKRLKVDGDRSPWLREVPLLLRDSFLGLTGLTGFGTLSGVVVRFDAPVGPLPGDAESSLTNDGLQLLDLGVDPPARVPFSVTTSDDGATLVLQPLRPMRRATEHAILITNALRGPDDGCIEPSPVTLSLLDGTAEAPQLAAVAPRVQAAVEAAGLQPAAIVGAAVFTTHDEVAVMRANAADIRGRAYAWSVPPVCEDATNGYRACVGAFEPFDYRDDRVVSPAAPETTWRVPVSVWLPAEGEPPYPTLMFGHGIGDRRASGRYLAQVVAPLGIAVIASDALEHGEHPTADGMGEPALAFLGLDLAGLKVDTKALRGNFNQTTLDRLQLLELVRGDPDVDGDGVPDLDGTRVGYWGISLGGMLGSSMLALSDMLQAGILSVAGGQLMLFITDTGMIAPLRPALENLAGGPDRLHRLLPVAQTLVDAADPAMYGAQILYDRGVEGPTPHVLFPVAKDDQTVPPASGRALARAMGIPHLAPVLTPVELIDVVEGPQTGNLDGTTAAYYQYDRVSQGNGRFVTASHGNTPLGPEPLRQALTFLGSWLDDGVPTIIDPFDE